MKTYSKKYLPLIIGLACAIGIVIGSLINLFNSSQPAFVKNSNSKKLDRLINYIDYDYVENVNTDSIVDVAINNILKNLDPHSTYISKSEFESFKEDMDGDFIGVGIQYFIYRDTVAVIRTIKDGPSEKAGLKPGDRILYANNTALFGLKESAESLKKSLRGDLNTDVDLKIKRPHEDSLLDIKVKRQHIPIKSVDAAFMLQPNLGYVKINRFSKTTYKEFKKAITGLEKNGATEIVLDLRDNGGGYLKQAIKIADEFLPKGKLIVFTKDRKGKVDKTYATDGGDFENTKVYVLINQNTASASEVVAGALQDNDIGTIVGRRSYGKGLVQRKMPFNDGSAVRLTVARYYTPTGRSIQKPYKSGDFKDYFHDNLKRYKDGELKFKDSIPINDSLKYTTPKGKIVYGGGGITPDVFIGKDLSYKKESLDYMLYGGILDHFVFELMDKDRAYYNSLSQEEFENNFEITDDILEELFQGFLKDVKKSFPKDYRSILKTYIKASFAKQLFGTDMYEKVLSKNDAMIEKVLELDRLPK